MNNAVVIQTPMKKYLALALTVSFAIPCGFYFLSHVPTWLVEINPNIYASILVYAISWFSLALLVDFIVSSALFLLLTGKPIHPAQVYLLGLIMAGIVWSRSLHPFYGISVVIWDLTMGGLIGLILGFSVLRIVKKL